VPVGSKQLVQERGPGHKRKRIDKLLFDDKLLVHVRAANLHAVLSLRLALIGAGVKFRPASGWPAG